MMNLEYGNGPEVVRLMNATTNGTSTTVGISGDPSDKSNLVTVIWAVNLTAFILVGLVVPIRVIVRCTVTRNFFSDDVLVIIAALFTFGICSMLPIATDVGLGQHYWNLDLELLPDDTRNLMMLVFIANILYPCAIAFARLSAICSFLRYITSKTMRYVMYGLAVLTGGFAIASVFTVIFQCNPVAAAWDNSIGGARCIPFFDYLHASTAIGIAIDVLLCTLPVPHFWKLKRFSTTTKALLTILFVFAGLACAVAIVKLVYLPLVTQVDVTYNWVSWILCSIAECTIAIVCISIPPIVPLFTKCSRRRSIVTEKPRHKRGKSSRFTVWAGKPTCNRAVAPRVIRPMATPWKDQPVETTTVSEFHWLKLEQLERGIHDRERVPLGPPVPLPFSLPLRFPTAPSKYHRPAAAQLETTLCAAYPKESRSLEVRNIAIALSVITFPAVALRCFSRWMITHRLWWDDWTAIFATILLAALAGVEIASADLGFGMHYWNVEPSAGEKLIKLFYVAQQIYILIQVFAKISILLFFSRIFPAKWFQLTVRYFIIFLFSHGFIFLLLIIFQCTPISSIWDRSNSVRKCMDVTAIGYAGAVFSIVEDLVILILPIPELYKLQLNIRKKIALGLMFSLGSFACITTMVRLKYLVTFSSTFDTTWDNVDIVIWSIIEEFCAILCASLPALRPLLQKVPRIFSTRRATTKTLSTSPSRRSILNHHGKDKFQEVPDTPYEPETPPTPIDIADELAAKADGKRQVLITRDNEIDVRADVELQNVRGKKKLQKDLNGRV
ncbi:integral membrane protein [Colletotrichum karsti]|uniref:Integral membrane protein n=1 Tax=Colletotrichum karsti TaxID=1095194 RepID=A0A9P6LHD0_9PEZI|nr:uncharacterized protein CkaCkLH20_09987 [Colletotrichum karsti]KAF9872490.1 integral membrane protein [Colletotrichum karsti]